MTQEFLMDKVISLIQNIPDYKSKKIIDLSCGDGYILEALHKDGCSIEGSHYKSNDYIVTDPKSILKNVVVHENVALDVKLPFKDQTYDIVVLTEVLEHIPNHLLIIQEIARILKPGGYFIMSTPNVYRLHSRLRFLLTETHKLIHRRTGWDTTNEAFSNYHINPVQFPLYHSLMRANKMEFVKIKITKFKIKHFYLLVLYPLILFYSFIEAIIKNENKLFRQGEFDLFKKMVSLPVQVSEQLLIVTKKLDD